MQFCGHIDYHTEFQISSDFCSTDVQIGRQGIDQEFFKIQYNYSEEIRFYKIELKIIPYFAFQLTQNYITLPILFILTWDFLWWMEDLKVLTKSKICGLYKTKCLQLLNGIQNFSIQYERRSHKYKKSINNLLTLDSQGTKTRRVNNPCTLLRNQVNSKYIELRLEKN